MTDTFAIEISDKPEDTLQQTADFAKIAYAEGISPKNQQSQIAVHFEEVAEMLATLSSNDPVVQYLIDNARSSVDDLATTLKRAEPNLIIIDEREFLDSVCDQLVTATLSAVLVGMDPVGGLKEVNRSNYSKLIDGKIEKDPVTAKWIKGPNYSPPDLTPFV